MNPKFWSFITLLLFLASCGTSETETTDDSTNNDSNDNLTLQDSSQLSVDDEKEKVINEWEIMKAEYPLLYGDPIIDQELAGPLKGFANKINDNLGKFEKIDEVFNAFKKMDLNQEQNDSAFFMYIEFLESIQPGEDEYSWEDGSSKKLEKKYGPHGLDVFYSEGMAGLTPNMYKVSKKFKGYLSKDLMQYVGIDDISDIQMFDDAALVVSWNEYADYILDLEDYVLKNTENSYYKYIVLSYSNSLDVLLWGIDNTPVLNGWGDEPRTLDPEVSKAYDRLINDKKHNTGKIISDHKKRLKENDYNVGWDDQWSYSKEEIEGYLGVK